MILLVLTGCGDAATPASSSAAHAGDSTAGSPSPDTGHTTADDDAALPPSTSSDDASSVDAGSPDGSTTPDHTTVDAGVPGVDAAIDLDADTPDARTFDAARPSSEDTGSSQPDVGGGSRSSSGPNRWDAGAWSRHTQDAGSPSATLDSGASTTPDSGTSPSPALDCRDASTWPASWVAFEDQVLQLTNQQRAAGATCDTSYFAPQPPLTSNPQLREAARCHSLDMAVQDYFSHTSLNGDTFTNRIDATGYRWRSAAENIAAGYDTPSSVVTGWMNSPGHCTNIMSNNTEIGVGYAYDAQSSYGYVWTQDFGTP